MPDMTDYHPTVARIKQLLDAHNCIYTCFEHEAVRTSEEAAATRPEYTINQGAKALIVRVKLKNVSKEEEKKFIQIVVPGDARFNPKKVRSVLNVKDVRFATEEEVGEITNGIVPGGVPPFGNLFGLEVVVEAVLLENDEIIFNAGDRRFSIAMKSADYLRVVQPKVLDIV
ncbi:MAG: Ala-tRNA(Pro) deacylase [Candidatus Azotimanducaceae bacterium]|jgi:Ala-tRNA(Pro) deacylase